MKQELKTIKIGDRIIAFYGDRNCSIEKVDNPSLYDIVLESITSKNDEKTIDILFNVDKSIEKAFSGKIKIVNGKVFYENVELPEIASKELISIHASGEKDFSPIERFYEKLKMASKNIDKINEILNQILSYNEAKIYFTKSGNLIVQALIDINYSKKTLYSSGPEVVSLFNNKLFGNVTNGEFYLINPMDILRTSNQLKYVRDGEILHEKEFIDYDFDVEIQIVQIFLRRMRKLRNFQEPKGLYVTDEFEDLYDIQFEFMKQLKKTY